MTVRVYRSTDASAPSLTGAVGSLTALLDACLVNGYGSQTAAGWSINQTTTNKRGYKQNLTGSNNSGGMLLYVDDTGPGAGGAKEARACGFETMSAITPTGTGQFPTSGQAGSITGGFVVIRKSATADATARAWTLVANGQTIYLFIDNGDQAIPIAIPGYFFGDFKSYKASDQYAVGIIGRILENSSGANTAESFSALSNTTVANCLTASLIGHFAARRHTGVGGSVRFGKVADIGRFTGSISGYYTSEAQTAPAFSNISIGRYNVNYPFQAPNSVDGSLWMSPIYLCHEGALRGYLPGLWCPLHDRPLAHNDTFTVSSGNLNGKSFQAIMLTCAVTGGNDQAMCFVETSDTWS